MSRTDNSVNVIYTQGENYGQKTHKSKLESENFDRRIDKIEQNKNLLHRIA